MNQSHKTLSAIWRHPIKSHGRESLASCHLHADQAMPFDRLWAVVHSHSKCFENQWQPCPNFSIGTKAPLLAAINITLTSIDDRHCIARLTHPQRPAINFNPDDADDIRRFLDWVAPLIPVNRAPSKGIVRLDERAFTDTDYPSISLINLNSNDSLSQFMNTEISPLRWRCNFWFAGDIPAWQEFTWIGRELKLGEAILSVIEPIERCNLTKSNPKTGVMDLDTLSALPNFSDGKFFGVYARVIKGGEVKTGDSIKWL